jgi:uncharacterized membrane protein
MKYGRKLIIVVCMIILCFMSTTAFSIMGPEKYEKMANKSEIKAIAVVNAVKVTGHKKALDYKMVTFELEKSFGTKMPTGDFKGRCESVNKRFYERTPGESATIYFYPKKGDRVYVTISREGGQITSYTFLTERLEKALSEDFSKVRIGMGAAYVSFR